LTAALISSSDTLQVLGCVDSRIDPGDVLGLELGEGVVMRNIGDRITPATLRSWALLGRLGQGQPSRGHLVILHHTDCGITRLRVAVFSLASRVGRRRAGSSWSGRG
jgi:carbonic anhydrase